MANKKLLLCAAIATGLLLTACVKKEEPKNEDQQEQTAETETSQAQTEPKNSEFETLESVDNQETTAPVNETIREETPNTTTEVRREIRPAETTTSSQTQTSTTEQPKPTQTEPKPVKTEPQKPATPAQSEEDAVAAAIAAATPALNN